MGWRQGPTGPVWVDEGDGAQPGGQPKSYQEAYGQQNEVSPNSPYAAYANQGAPAGGAGFGSGMAPVGAGQTRQGISNRNMATSPPPPDGWSGWKWNGAQWVIPNGMQGEHDMWIAGEEAKAAAAAASAGRPTMDDMRAEGFDTGNIADQRMPEAPTIEQDRINDARAARDGALADQRRVLEMALNLAVDPVERQALQDRFQERMLASANTVASNARGGAGAAAAQRQLVGQQVPAMAGQAAEQARQETLAAFQARVQAAQTAGGIAATIGQTATTAFGQEQSLATDSAKLLLSSIGLQVDADLKQQQLLGAMLQDLNNLGLSYDTLDVNTQLKVFDAIAQQNNIDNQIAGQIKLAAEQNKKGVMDYVMGFLGAGEKVAGAASGLGWKPLAP